MEVTDVTQPEEKFHGESGNRISCLALSRRTPYHKANEVDWTSRQEDRKPDRDRGQCGE